MFVGWEGVGPLLVPADRLLVPEEVGVRRRQEGVHRQPHRRLRVHARRAAALRRGSARSTSRRSRARSSALAPGDDVRHDLAHHAAAVRRRDRQVGADSALRLAARRDGRPDAGVGAHPRGDDGDGRRVHDRAQRRAVQPCAADADDRRGHRRGDGAHGRHDRPRAERHQARAGVLDRVAARLHVPGDGRRRVRAPASSISTRTRSSRRCCSSDPARSFTRWPASRTCGGWAG